jgi:hypothetical protein
MGKWVLKRFMTKLFESGFTINRCAVDGLASRGISCEAFASFPSAFAVLIINSDHRDGALPGRNRLVTVIVNLFLLMRYHSTSLPVALQPTF